jgi:hypothetical protein
MVSGMDCSNLPENIPAVIAIRPAIRTNNIGAYQTGSILLARTLFALPIPLVLWLLTAANPKG